MDKLCIDLGSTDIKYCAEGEGTPHAVPFPMTRADDPYFEADPEAIAETVMSIAAKYPYSKTLLISVQMHGYILRMRDGTFLPYLSWRDRRARGYFEKGVFQRSMLPYSGTSYKANLPLISLQYRQKEEGLDLASVKELFTLGSYLSYRLTGRNVTHITDAAATGFYDVFGGSASPWGFALPLAMTAVTPIGSYEGKTVIVPIGDQQASVSALAPAVLRENVVLNLGTAAQVCCVGEVYCDREEEGFECRPFFGGKYLYTVTGLLGGAWIREHSSESGACEAAAQSYADALRKLPHRRGIAAIGGGVAAHHGAFLRAVLDSLGSPFTIYPVCVGQGLLEVVRRGYEAVRFDDQ